MMSSLTSLMLDMVKMLHNMYKRYLNSNYGNVMTRVYLSSEVPRHTVGCTKTLIVLQLRGACAWNDVAVFRDFDTK